MQDAAEKLGEDVAQFKDNLGPIVEAAKKIARMWMKMAQLIRYVRICREGLQHNFHMICIL